MINKMREIMRFVYAWVIGAQLNVAWHFRNLHGGRDKDLIKQFRISGGRLKLENSDISVSLDKLISYSDYLPEIYEILKLDGRLKIDNHFLFSTRYRVNDLEFKFLIPGNIQAFREIFLEGIYNLTLVPNRKYIVIDVGMNIGLSTLFFASNDFVDKVYGFELVPDTFRLAKENIERNKWAWSKCIPSNIAWGAENKSLFIKGSLAGSVSASIFTDLVAHGDEIFMAHPKEHAFILKLDCEGAEYEVIKNLSETGLLNTFTCIMIEWHFYGSDELCTTLKKHGFNSIVIANANYKYQIGMIYAFNNNIIK
jgi:FkbM family methyltransferase